MAERDIDEVERIVREFVTSLGAEPTDATIHLRWTVRVGAVRSLLKRTLERADAALAPVVPSSRTTGGRDMDEEKEPESTRQRLSMADDGGVSFNYAGPETAKDDSPFSPGSMASGSSTEKRILDREAKLRRCREELASRFGHKPETIGEAIRKNNEALDRASDEALSLAAERIAKRDTAGGLYGPFMVPASERSHAPGSPPTAECGCHLPGINGHDPRYCKERERIIGTQGAAHVGEIGEGQRTFTRTEVLTVLRAKRAEAKAYNTAPFAPGLLLDLITIFENME